MPVVGTTMSLASKSTTSATAMSTTAATARAPCWLVRVGRLLWRILSVVLHHGVRTSVLLAARGLLLGLSSRSSGGDLVVADVLGWESLVVGAGGRPAALSFVVAAVASVVVRVRVRASAASSATSAASVGVAIVRAVAPGTLAEALRAIPAAALSPAIPEVWVHELGELGGRRRRGVVDAGAGRLVLGRAVGSLHGFPEGVEIVVWPSHCRLMSKIDSVVSV